MSGTTDLDELLRTLEPVLVEGDFVYASVDDPQGLPVLATVVEAEGTTVVLQQGDADAAGLTYELVLAWITLNVHSSLEAVGLTAAFSHALGQAGISCNVLAGFFHDHILVPTDRADEAMQVLRALSS